MPEVQTSSPAQRVTVTDIDMPFGSMVVFMLKWALAAIPAVLILAFLGAVLSAVVAGMFGGFESLRSGSTARSSTTGGASYLQSTIQEAGNTCPAVSREVRQGERDQATYYSVVCSNGNTFSVRVLKSGGAQVQSCADAERDSAPCFRVF